MDATDEDGLTDPKKLLSKMELDVVRDERRKRREVIDPDVNARTRRQVLRMRGYGFSINEISTLMCMSADRVKKLYGSELERGELVANTKVIRTIYEVATDKNHRQVMQAATFWARHRMGWKDEPRGELAASGAEGGAPKVIDASKLTPEQRETLRELMESVLRQQQEEASKVSRLAGVDVDGEEEENAVEEEEGGDAGDGGEGAGRGRA